MEDKKTEREKALEQALLEYVQRYGLLPLAREVLKDFEDDQK